MPKPSRLLGVLALQGDFQAHLEILRRCQIDAIPVRTPGELAQVHALILPGGESTTLANLLEFSGLSRPLFDLLALGLPTFSTCAGLILLSKTVPAGRLDQASIPLLDLTVQRNAYGRQINSFEAQLEVSWFPRPSFPGVFIRAPLITWVGPEVQVLATFANHPVAIFQPPHLGLCFHPELTNDLRFHRRFIATLTR